MDTTARVALYDDLLSAPRITKIDPAPTVDYIENLASTIYEQAKLSKGSIPYSVIREVSENFIHAQFREIVVSILDDGNTIRFADQGPGIQDAEKAQKPGFTSAIEPMKDYIRGVGSGLPIVREYMADRKGSIVIEDNLESGAVVTVSLIRKEPASAKPTPTPVSLGASFAPHIPLSDRERTFLRLFLREGDLGVTDIFSLTDIPKTTVHNTLSKLEESGLIEISIGKKRKLTELGRQVILNL